MTEESDYPYNPSPSEWIDASNKCTICGAKVNQDVNLDSHQDSAAIDDHDYDNNQRAAKRICTRSPNMEQDEIARMEDDEIARMEDTEIARVVYTKQLKLYWPKYSSCTNCFKNGPSRVISEDKLATTLLDAQLEEIQAVNNSSIANSKCVTLMIDGWNRTHAAYDHVVLNTCVHTGIDAGHPIFLCSKLAENYKDPNVVSKVIGKIVTELSRDVRSNLRAIVTDNCGPNDVVSAAMNAVEEIFSEPIRIYCYGSASDAIKELANDFCNIVSIQMILINNQIIAQFFSTDDVRKKLHERYKDENSLKFRGTIPADNIYVGLHAFIMLGRNLELHGQLKFIINNCVELNELENYNEVHKLLMDRDMTFWASTQRIAYVYNVLTNVLRFCKNCNLPLSVMPHIWAHITLHLSINALKSYGFNHVAAQFINIAVANKRAVYVRPIMCAAHALDPYFKGRYLNDEEWAAAHDVILSMSSYDATVTSTEFTKYREMSRLDHSRDEYLMNLQTDSYSQNRIKCWNRISPKSPLAEAAMLLLSMPASVANVKRYNKAHVLQLHKSIWIDQIRDRLAEVSYNLIIKSHYDGYKDTAADTMKELLSLCTVHPPLIEIRNEITNEAQPNLTNSKKLMLICPDEGDNNLAQQHRIVHPGQSNVTCSENCPQMLAPGALSQEYNSEGYYKYDSFGGESQWSNDCPFVSDEENTDSSYSVNNSLFETAGITASYCRQFIPLKVDVGNSPLSSPSIPSSAAVESANLLIHQPIPLTAAAGSTDSLSHPLIPDSESHNSVGQINEPLIEYAPSDPLWSPINIEDLLPDGEGLNFNGPLDS